MSFFKSLWADLIEKRLWPVALGLVAALVAVPIVLGGGAGSTAATTGTTGITGATGAVAQIALDVAVPERRDRAGAVRNPFKQRAAAKAKAANTAIAPTPSSEPPSSVVEQTPLLGGDSGGGPGIGVPPFGGSGDGAPDPAEKKPAAPKSEDYLVELRFGETGAARARKEIGRLTPLPSAENPLLVYLGVLSDKKTAVFLLPVGITATGDGTCKPRATSCETVELRAGDTEVLDVTDDDGKVVQYELELLRVTKEGADRPSPSVAPRKAGTSGAKTQAKRPATTSAKLSDARDDDDLGSDRYSYDDETGLLERISSRPRDDDDGFDEAQGLHAELALLAADFRRAARADGADASAIADIFPGL